MRYFLSHFSTFPTRAFHSFSFEFQSPPSSSSLYHHLPSDFRRHPPLNRSWPFANYSMTLLFAPAFFHQSSPSHLKGVVRREKVESGKHSFSELLSFSLFSSSTGTFLPFSPLDLLQLQLLSTVNYSSHCRPIWNAIKCHLSDTRWMKWKKLKPK